ncbi:MAG: AraC family transcriptional regulator [Sinobacterium sp.]|nr:AraC family transcriptional regulator [Sinobacterium sp.]
MLAILTGVDLGIIMLLAMIMYRDYGIFLLAKVFTLFLFLVSAFLLQPYVPEDWVWLTSYLILAIPATFWSICHLTFDKRPKLLSVFTLLAIYTVLVPWLIRAVYGSTSVPPVPYFIGWSLAQYFELIILANGLWVIAANRKNDLVETRRQLRVAVLIVAGSAVIWAVVSMNAGLTTPYSRIFVVLLPGITLSYFLLQGHRGLLNGERLHQMGRNSQKAFKYLQAESITDDYIPRQPDIETLQIKIDTEEFDKAYQALCELMADGYYRHEKITIKALSKAIALPEYKMRRLINQRLKYRNFNDYINTLRIEEACLRLEQEPDTPILNIALDIGYRSLSSFNRAFKTITEHTPTQYREKHGS